jgi:2'-5' RNA ligase
MRPRESAIDICLPELAELVDHWRLPTVPVASQGVPPHVTLLYPWRPAPVPSADMHKATRAVLDINPFTLTFQRVGRFPGALFLCPEPESMVRRLTQRLMHAFPETPPYGGQFGADPTPHLTVALAETEEELNRLQADILARLEPLFPLRVPIEELSVEEEGPDGTWQIVATIELNGG